ncbi:MAG: hypothetical protein L6R45_11310 [Anaerolineae bacterium]|nr:hypothetical protein [Anaerolineae bacterium]
MKGLNLKIFARLSRVVAIIIGIFLTACSLFLPRGVEELVPTDEDALQGWALSPQGDQLIYTSRTRDTIGAAVIFDLTTNQKRLIPKDVDCGFPPWIDNETIFCWGEPALVNSQDLSIIPVQRIDASQVDMQPLLTTSRKIYLFEEHPETMLLLTDDILSSDNLYFILNVPNVETLTDTKQLTSQVSHTVIPKSYIEDIQSDKIYSPNGDYYYILIWNVSLSIYASKDDELLVTVPLESNENIKIGGWVYDSSGVIYQINRIGPLGTTSPIYKLNVP